jgi:hypothetical protein
MCEKMKVFLTLLAKPNVAPDPGFHFFPGLGPVVQKPISLTLG